MGLPAGHPAGMRATRPSGNGSSRLPNHPLGGRKFLVVRDPHPCRRRHPRLRIWNTEVQKPGAPAAAALRGVEESKGVSVFVCFEIGIIEDGEKIRPRRASASEPPDR